MNGKSWLVTLACVVIAIVGTWFVAKKDATPNVEAGKEAAAKTDDNTVKILVAYSKPLVSFTRESNPNALLKLLFESELKLPNGKRIVIERVGMGSREMVENVVNGTVKAHVIIPSSEVFLDLADRESTLRTGKPLTSEKVLFTKQPHIIAVRRPMAEAMGWPNKELGWANVIDIAKNGWKAAGHPEWGPLRIVLGNPNISDSGVHSAMSATLAVLGKSKGLTEADLQSPALVDAVTALDGAAVWYPQSIDEFVRNDALGVPPYCHMVGLPEHSLRALNDHSMRRKAPAEWVAIYPDKATIVDDVKGAVVQREWVSDEQREAASMALNMLKHPKVQEKLLELGHRPVVADLPVASHLNEAIGVSAKLPEAAISELPPVEVIVDSTAVWNKVWKSRTAGPSGTPLPPATTPSEGAGLPTVPLSMQKLTTLSPTVQCVRRARPATVTIRDGNNNKVRGTGVIVDERGYAVTNRHVVGADKVVAVNHIESDAKIVRGDVIWADANQDLAIVKIAGEGKFPAVKYCPSYDREVGETVIAIGNPLGYTGTVTVGIISALNRDVTLPSGATIKCMQTDAGINPGNSGGPLLDVEGQLIGIVFAMREGAQNIAFVIPLERVRAVVKEHVPN